MLRGVNVGGSKKIEMEKLRRLFESIGHSNVRSYIQSGNVIFDAESEDIHELQTLLETNMNKTFGFETKAILRTMKQIKTTIRENPFAKKDEHFLHVIFLQQNPKKDYVLEDIEKMKSGEEDFHISSREVYLYLPYGAGRTKLNNTLFEKKLGVFATTRNWNTVNAFLTLTN
jgi:uncharacterized protein (DUF1697 family)